MLPCKFHWSMLGLVALLIVLVAISPIVHSQRIRLNAKELLRGKVLGRGYSVSAKSLGQCIEHCNKRQDTCDGIVYHDIIGKCRLISKCAPVRQVDSSQTSVYYSKRPQIKASGYIYDGSSDSCMGLIPTQQDYASADRACAKMGGHLALIKKQRLNTLAGKLTAGSGSNWTWIEEGNIAPNIAGGKTDNNVLPVEVFTPMVVQRRDSALKSCWGIDKNGQWGQFSCKNTTMPALCQIPLFPS